MSQEIALAARAYAERGWQPLPIRPGSKAPALAKEWQRFRCRPDEVQRHFSHGGGVGLLLGEPSSGLVDVDLDCPEAIELARCFLPGTGMKHGRPGADDSHWWYVCDRPPRTEKWHELAPDGSKGQTLVELRGTGGQTVVPPSVHPGTRQPYAWSKPQGNPAKVGLGELRSAIAQLASAAFLVRSGWPTSAAVAGVTHDDQELPERVREWLGYSRPQASAAGDGTPNPYTLAVLERCDPQIAMRELGLEPVTRGLCPLRQHEHATDAFTIDGWKWFCHACEDGGDAIKLVALARGIEYHGARKWLGDRLGVVDPWERGRRPPAAARPERQDDGERAPVIVWMNTVVPEPVQFLWRPYLVRNKINLLSGDPEAGKSWIALAIAASVSLGQRLEAFSSPGSWAESPEPGTVLYMTGEDGLADTVANRLEVVGADASRVAILDGYATRKEGVSAVSIQDLDVIGAALEEVRPALLVIDPIQQYLGPKVNMNYANEVRPVMDGLRRLVERHQTTCLVIRHLSKGATGKAMYRGMGTMDFTAIARSELLAGQIPNGEGRAVVHLKSSLAAKGKPLGYDVTELGVEWQGPVDITAAELSAPERPRSQERVSKVDLAIAWVEELLRAEGSIMSLDAYRRGRDAGHSRYALEQARDYACESKRVVRKGGRTDWLWWPVGTDEPGADGRQQTLFGE